jgi:hypothetical protein
VILTVFNLFGVVQEFKDCDKKALLEKAAEDILSSIKSLAALTDPFSLFRFVLLSFADLKTYRFTYWFGWPALIPTLPFTANVVKRLSTVDFSNILGPSYSTPVFDVYKGLVSDAVWRGSIIDASSQPVENANTTDRPTDVEVVTPVFALIHDGNCGGEEVNTGWRAVSLKEAWDRRHSDSCLIVIADLGSSNTFGWPLRNLLALFAAHVPTDDHTAESTANAQNTESSESREPAAQFPYHVNIVALRGQLAKRILSSCSQEQASELLSRFTDEEISKSEVTF